MRFVRKSYMVKEPLQEERPMDFNVTEYKKFVDTVLDSVLQLIFF